MESLGKKFRPHVYMVLSQVGYTFLYFITEASFNHGMNPHVYVTYRHVISATVMVPFAYFLERKLRPKLTWALFGEIFILSLLGVSLTLNMYFASLKYTSPTFVSSMVNTIPSTTFLIAVVLRLEMVNIRKTKGIAKVTGTLVSLCGVLIMTLYKGSLIRNVVHPPLSRAQGGSDVHENWVKGTLLIVASCITWSISYIMQAYTLKRYPAQLSLTSWMCVVGAAQSAVYTVCVEHTRAAWTIGFDIDLWSTIYGGVVVSGLILFVQLWCTDEKGPVFVTVFNPLATLLVAVLAYFVFGERLFVGSVLGGAILILGLYLLLWGKEGDESASLKSEEPNYDDSLTVKPKIAIEEP
ncbi:uncharacterized protein [Phyllobates terribilis]|uniref:uncharacterized protein n=1 Tax=Phyllobates terribilis TaxID=111132 RepID=UPI003CCB3793